MPGHLETGRRRREVAKKAQLDHAASQLVRLPSGFALRAILATAEVHTAPVDQSNVRSIA